MGGMMGGSFGGLDGLGGSLMGFGLMGIVPLAVVGLIVWLIVEATRGNRRPDTPAYMNYPVQPPAAFSQPASPPAAGALALLDDRYARGEIDRDEYLQRRRDLQS